MYTVTPYDDRMAHDICYDCGSPVSKKSYNYFRKILFCNRYNVWSKIWKKDGTPVGFYFATRCRDHVRLIEIAVRTEYQGKGIGKMMLRDLLSTMKTFGLYKLTFRTPIDEPAADFWLHAGATITGLKDNDYEMQINIR